MTALRTLDALANLIRAFVYATVFCYVIGQMTGAWLKPRIAYQWEQRQFYVATLRSWQLAVEGLFTLDTACAT